MNRRVARLTCQAALAILGFACLGPFQRVVLSGRTVLPSGRAVFLEAPEPLRIVGSRNHLCLELLPYNSLNWPPFNQEMGIRRSDGVLVTFGAALVRQDGTSDTLSSTSYSMGTEDWLQLGPSTTDSLRPPFTGVRVTASKTIAVRRIVWRSYTSW
jgi:hypothetical protein